MANIICEHRRFWGTVGVFMLLLTGGCTEKAVSADATPGCSKDTDCKGDRVCLGGKCQPPPQSAATQTGSPVSLIATPPVASASSLSAVAALPKATITVPKNQQGLAQRAIVKDKAGPAGEEIARIANGTTVGVVKKAEGGLWVNIRWPWPDGTQEGWVHVNLIRE